MHGKRKYLSEFGVNLFSAGWIMVPANQLASSGTMAQREKQISDRCHIYLFCQHPAFSYTKDTFLYYDGHINGEITYRIEGDVKKVPFRRPFPLLDGAVKVELSPYPYREIHTTGKDGKILRSLPASVLCLTSPIRLQDPEIGKFEVLYVGQAFADGKRSAFERLKSHSTLQKTLADAQYHAPDNEVYLFMFEYVPYRVITQMDGRADVAIKGIRDKERFFSIFDNPLTEHQQVCLIEAGLIRYFAPKYNEIYKNSFPSPTQKILAQCYELDFSALIVEINTDELDLSLHSQRVAARMHHIAQIDLFGHEERYGFFHMSKDDGSFASMPDVIR